MVKIWKELLWEFYYRNKFKNVAEVQFALRTFNDETTNQPKIARLFEAITTEFKFKKVDVNLLKYLPPSVLNKFYRVYKTSIFALDLPIINMQNLKKSLNLYLTTYIKDDNILKIEKIFENNLKCENKDTFGYDLAILCSEIYQSLLRKTAKNTNYHFDHFWMRSEYWCVDDVEKMKISYGKFKMYNLQNDNYLLVIDTSDYHTNDKHKMINNYSKSHRTLLNLSRHV